MVYGDEFCRRMDGISDVPHAYIISPTRLFRSDSDLPTTRGSTSLWVSASIIIIWTRSCKSGVILPRKKPMEIPQNCVRCVHNVCRLCSKTPPRVSRSHSPHCTNSHPRISVPRVAPGTVSVTIISCIWLSILLRK